MGADRLDHDIALARLREAAQRTEDELAVLALHEPDCCGLVDGDIEWTRRITSATLLQAAVEAARNAHLGGLAWLDDSFDGPYPDSEAIKTGFKRIWRRPKNSLMVADYGLAPRPAADSVAREGRLMSALVEEAESLWAAAGRPRYSRQRELVERLSRMGEFTPKDVRRIYNEICRLRDNTGVKSNQSKQWTNRFLDKFAVSSGDKGPRGGTYSPCTHWRIRDDALASVSTKSTSRTMTDEEHTAARTRLLDAARAEIAERTAYDESLRTYWEHRADGHSCFDLQCDTVEFPRRDWSVKQMFSDALDAYGRGAAAVLATIGVDRKLRTLPSRLSAPERTVMKRRYHDLVARATVENEKFTAMPSLDAEERALREVQRVVIHSFVKECSELERRLGGVSATSVKRKLGVEGNGGWYRRRKEEKR